MPSLPRAISARSSVSSRDPRYISFHHLRSHVNSSPRRDATRPKRVSRDAIRPTTHVYGHDIYSCQIRETRAGTSLLLASFFFPIFAYNPPPPLPHLTNLKSQVWMTKWNRSEMKCSSARPPACATHACVSRLTLRGYRKSRNSWFLATKHDFRCLKSFYCYTAIIVRRELNILLNTLLRMTRQRIDEYMRGKQSTTNTVYYYSIICYIFMFIFIWSITFINLSMITYICMYGIHFSTISTIHKYK